MEYNPNKIEKRWQEIWEKIGIYETPDKVPGKKNFYHLAMFPYSSGDLHIGHWYNLAPADVHARFKKRQRFNLLSPIGFDAFGLPAENAAIKRGIHPKVWTHQNIKKMRAQLKSMGPVFDWKREVITCEPDYYKWTQWMFLQLYKVGLAYRAKVPANWCPSCKTILANEQVVEGKCERCDSQVLQKEIEQWLFKITDFAEDLLKDLETLDWPERTKIMQKNWIGKSEGWVLQFGISNSKTKTPVFTTRTDTLFGATYAVIAPEHWLIEKFKNKIKNYKYVKQYVEDSKKKTELERISEVKEKTGIEIKGVKAINPANNRALPIFVADYVLVHYGTGAIMAVPAHDQRDFDFAKRYNLPIIEVIKAPNNLLPDLLEKAYEGEGILVNSGRFDGMKSTEAKERIGEWLAKSGLSKRAVYYKLRDWIVSRQRYWGAPIPMIYCKECARLPGGQGWQPVKEEDLPVLLPEIRNFLPTSEGESPLAKSKKFVEVICPKCQNKAERETDTLDTFVCSSWYYLRYTDSKNEKEFAAKNKIKSWLPVDFYIGGAEHTVMHLLYSRFFTKVLKKLGYLDFQEPFLKLRHQGIILGLDGQKMSKSRGNVVDPDELVRKYGADVVRMYLCFMGPYSQGGPWNPKGIGGIARFLNKVWNFVTENLKQISGFEKTNSGIEKLIHKTIKKVTEDLEDLKFNTAVSALMILVNEMQKEKNLPLLDYKMLVTLLAPFAPHLSEELWQKLKLAKPRLGDFKPEDSVHNQPWPKYSPRKIQEKKIQLIIQIQGKVRDKIEVEAGISEERAKKLAISREKVKKWIRGREIKKVIFVPGKLINIVV